MPVKKNYFFVFVSSNAFITILVNALHSLSLMLALPAIILKIASEESSLSCPKFNSLRMLLVVFSIEVGETMPFKILLMILETFALPEKSCLTIA